MKGLLFIVAVLAIILGGCANDSATDTVYYFKTAQATSNEISAPSNGGMVYIPINKEYAKYKSNLDCVSSDFVGATVAASFNEFRLNNPGFTVKLESVFRDSNNDHNDGGNVWGIWVNCTPKHASG